MNRDAPYPELKKTHTMAHTGRPWRDHKPPPAAPVWAVIQGYGSYFILCAAVELGVFDALARIGGATAEELAADLDVSAPHLASLLDGVVAMGLLEQVRDRYQLNETAERYLVRDGAATMADLVAVAPGPLENWTRLADTVRKGRPATPVDDDPAAFYVPLVRATFPTQLRVATRTALLLGLARTSRPLRVLDLGAGGAPWAIGFLTARPGSTAVVNDLAEVLDAVARQKVVEHGVAPQVEFRPGDFRTLELEPGTYDVVVLGHVCRTEGAEGAPRLIRRAFDALAPEGRLVLADYFVDNTRKFNPFGVLMGTTMMASTLHGNGFTHETYHRWIGEAGFRPIRLVEPIGFNQVYVATRPRSST